MRELRSEKSQIILTERQYLLFSSRKSMYYFFFLNQPDNTFLTSENPEECFILLKKKILKGIASAEEIFAFSCIVDEKWDSITVANHRLEYLCMAIRKYKYPKAIYELYELLDMGEEGFPHDPVLAHRFLKLACRYKFPQAYWQMGMVKIYEENKVSEGIQLIKYSAKNGVLQAYGQLLDFCRLGLFGFSKNYYWLYLIYKKALLTIKHEGISSLLIEIKIKFFHLVSRNNGRDN